MEHDNIGILSDEKKGKLANTFGYYAAFVILGMSTAVLGPTLPGLAEQTHTKLSEISFLFTAVSLGYMLGSIYSGRVYDRIPGNHVLAAVLLLMALMLALVPLIPMLWILTLTLFILGIGESTVDVGGNTLLVWVHRERVGPFMNALHFFFGTGAFIAPIIIAWAIMISGDIHWAYWMFALAAIPVAVILARLHSPQSPPFHLTHQGNHNDYRLVALISIFFFLYVGAEVSYGGWIFTYVVSLNLVSETTAALLTSAFWGALTVGRLVAIPIAFRVKPRTILVGDLSGSVVSLSLLIAFPNSLAVIWIGTIGLGLFNASIFPTMMTLAERWLPIKGEVSRWFFVGTGAGGMVLPWLIGQLFVPLGPLVTMVLIFADLLLAIGVYAGLSFLTSKRYSLET